jgi:beta-lactamase regulating signal transducer with metallopeptidase domain
MAQFAYSFCMAMLHSFWQAALLAVTYFLLVFIVNEKAGPLQKKKLLFLSVTIQLLLFVATFISYYIAPESSFDKGLFAKNISTLLSADKIHQLAPWLFTIYITVILYKAVKIISSWFYFKKQYYLGIQKPAVHLKLFTGLQALRFGIKRKVVLLFSTTLNTPVTFGFLKPVIILPVALVNQLSMAQAEALIIHELTHIKANDYLFNWLVILVQTLFFFNPFVLLLCKKISLEREKHCDVSVLSHQYTPLFYAETLLAVQQVKSKITSFQLAAAAKPEQLLKRILFFTNDYNKLNPYNNRSIFPLLAILPVLFFAGALIFQTAITTTPQSVTNSPTNQYSKQEKEIATIVNSILHNLGKEKMSAIEAMIKKQQPLIEKQIKKIQPLLNKVIKEAKILQPIYEEPADESGIFIPATMQESENIKQIVIREEESGSKNAVIKVYTAVLLNGKWVLQPQWKLAGKEIPSIDSVSLLPDSSLINLK